MGAYERCRGVLSRPAVLALLAAFTLVIPLAVLPAPVRAVTQVTVPIDITVAEAGAPAFTWTIGGSCAPSQSSGSTGATVDILLNPSCTFTINTPTDTSTQRDRFTIGGGTYVTSLSETSCASGTCATITDTAHVEELLTVSTNCNTPVLKPASPTGDKWYDYGTSVTVTCNGVWGRTGGVGTRATSWNWDGGGNTNVATFLTFTSSAQSMTAGHTFNVNTVTQYQLVLDPGATRALSSLTTPTLGSDYYWYDNGIAVTYTGSGIFGRAAGAGNRSTSWSLDSGSSTQLNSANTFTVQVTMTATHAIHVSVVTQYQVTLSSATVSMLSSITSPTLAGDNYWYDSGTKVTVTVNGVGARSAGVGTRIASYSINGGVNVIVASSGSVAILNGAPIAAGESISSSVVTQYQLSLDVGASAAIASITSTPIPGDNYWYDAGTQVTYTGNGVYGRSAGAGDRLSTWWVDSGKAVSVLTTATVPVSINMGAPHFIHTTSVAQFQVSPSGKYAVASETSPTIPGDGFWYDSGTAVSFSLEGVFGRAAGTGERTTSYAVNNGPSTYVTSAGSVPVLNSVPLTSPVTVSVQAVTQYQLTLDAATTQALSSVSPPTVSGDNYWYDSGSAISLSLNGVWARNATSEFRLTSYSVDKSLPTSVATSGLVTISLGQATYPRSVSATVVKQFLLAVEGGAGVSFSVGPPIPKDTGWYDSGTVVNVSSRAAFDSNGTTRQKVSSWSIDGGPSNAAGIASVVTTSPIMMNSPHTVVFSSVTQYRVAMIVKDFTGSVTLPSPVVLVSISGATQSVTGGGVWSDIGATIQVTNVNWRGVDVTPAQTTTYTVASPFNITLNAKVFEAKVAVKDLLGLGVGGARYTITFANRTIIHGNTPGDGVIDLGAIPLGTFDGSVSYLGLTTSFSGDAASSPTTGVVVFLSYSLVAILIAAVAVVVVFLVLWRRRAPEPEKFQVYKPAYAYQ